jgi:hypothetical protein
MYLPILQVASKDSNQCDNMAEALGEINETIRSCEREFELYPGNEI